MDKKISPLPWEQEGLWIKDAGLDCIVRCLNALDGDTDTNAAFIVKACNSHDELVAALAFYASEQKWDEFRSDQVDAAFDRNTGSALGDDGGKTARAILAKLEAK